MNWSCGENGRMSPVASRRFSILQSLAHAAQLCDAAFGGVLGEFAEVLLKCRLVFDRGRGADDGAVKMHRLGGGVAVAKGRGRLLGECRNRAIHQPTDYDLCWPRSNRKKA